MKNQREKLPLPEAVTHLLEECRMVLPGIQALFGFQLIAVFNSSFAEKLTHGEQMLHLTAMVFVAAAIALVMAPAAYHRQNGPEEVSDGFILVASRLLLCAMFPLMLAISLEFYLIARLILDDATTAAVLSGALLCIFSGCWFIVPRLQPMQRTLRGGR